MPCHDYGYDDWASKNPEKAMQSHYDILNAAMDKVHKLTKLLCFVCKQIELGDKANFDCEEAKELWLWWEEHKKLDKQRENNNATK